MLTSTDINLLIGISSLLLSLLFLAIYARFSVSKGQLESALQTSRRQWFSNSKAKKWTELFFMKYSVVWISWFGVVVISGVWETFGPNEYMIVGTSMAVPCFVLPWLRSSSIISNNENGLLSYLPTFLQYLINMLLPPMPAEELSRPFTQQFWVKANAWIAIISIIGNYVWTHYFYRLLRATYTFSAHRINFVPIAMFLCTHAYFCTYHTLTTIVLRRWWTSATYSLLGKNSKALVSAGLILTLAIFTALTEAITIQNFPYYRIEDREWFYSVGSVVYSIYFIVSFPAYYLLDEDVNDDDNNNTKEKSIIKSIHKEDEVKRRRRRSSTSGEGHQRRQSTSQSLSVSSSSSIINRQEVYTLARACTESLAACMLVTLLLEAWRLVYTGARGLAHPGLLPFPPSDVSIDLQQGLPWI
jgi:cycloeucalenol cycloisomerase